MFCWLCTSFLVENSTKSALGSGFKPRLSHSSAGVTQWSEWGSYEHIFGTARQHTFAFHQATFYWFFQHYSMNELMIHRAVEQYGLSAQSNTQQALGRGFKPRLSQAQVDAGVTQWSEWGSYGHLLPGTGRHFGANASQLLFTTLSIFLSNDSTSWRWRNIASWNPMRSDWWSWELMQC